MNTSPIKLRIDISKTDDGYGVTTWVFDKKTGSTLNQRLNGTYPTLKEAREAKKNIKDSYFG